MGLDVKARAGVTVASISISLSLSRSRAMRKAGAPAMDLIRPSDTQGLSARLRFFVCVFLHSPDSQVEALVEMRMVNPRNARQDSPSTRRGPLCKEPRRVPSPQFRSVHAGA